LYASENKPVATDDLNYSYGEGVTIAQVFLLCAVRFNKFIQSMADKNAVSAKGIKQASCKFFDQEITCRGF
jgi:hypothetical protein